MDSRQRVSFQSDQYKLIGYWYQVNKTQPTVLFLHGAAKDAKENIFAPWQTYLAKHGYNSFSFFSRGVGESTGNYQDSSLNNREKDALSAINFLKDKLVDSQDKLVILGNSMGGHVAAKLSNSPDISAVILYSSAAYGQAAENVPLNHSFTEIIRKEDSWKDSLAFTNLKSSNKPTLIIYQENDTVIPKKIQNKFYKNLNNKDNFFVVPVGNHTTISGKTSRDKKTMMSAFKKSLDFLKNMFPDATFLGVSNPKDPRATDLQNIVLKKTGIKRQPFTRK